ncbi:MAG: pilus assembly protein TadG-related protein [Burkholderiales bacterium]
MVQHVSFKRSWPLLKGRRYQQGQALVYGIFVMMGGLAALFFLFNTGQLSREKTKLVNTADAVAYSAGVMNARALNFEAYTNRAMVANTVAIAQLVSLSSWMQYVNNLADYGWVADNPKFAPFYPSYEAALSAKGLVDPSDLGKLAEISDDIIRKALMTAQQVAYAGLIPARQEIMDDVAKANYHSDGLVTVEQLTLPSNDFTGFVSRYSDDQRTRFAEVAKIAAYRDKFLPKRSWLLPGLWSDCGGATATGRVDFLTRRGGTELLGFDEWKAMDTLSEKRWVPKSKTDALCMAIAETPAGWGLQSAADSPSLDLDPTHYDYSLAVNPGSSALAIATSSDSWGYSGLPNFYDLSNDALKQDDPRLQFAIRVRRDKSQTVTSEGRSTIATSSRLNAYHALPAGGSELVAVSASEVFFQRPADAQNNVYGESIGKPHEIGSLFNPYWQVRLIQSADNIRKAQAMQGAVLP